MRVGRGGALQVSWVMSEILCIKWSRSMQAICHWSFVSWSVFSVFVSSFMWSAFSSKYFVLNFSMLAWGMGLSIRGGLSVIVGISRASNVFGGICSVTGEWSELRLWAVSVVDVYSALLGVLI